MKTLFLTIAVSLLLCMNANAQWNSDYDNTWWSAAEDYIDSLQTRIEADDGGVVFPGKVAIDPQGAISLDGAVTSQLNVATSVESWWGASAFRNYWNNGYTDTINVGSQSVAMEIKQLVEGTGTPPSRVEGLVIHNDWRAFTGSYDPNAYIIGSSNAFVPPPTDEGTVKGVVLNDHYIDYSTSSAGYNFAPTDGISVYKFRLGGDSDFKFSGSNNYTFYSDMSGGASSITGTWFHFYGKGDYPSFFGGKVNAGTGYNFAVDAQVSDAYIITLKGAHTLVAGLDVTFIANTANTDGATLQVNSLTAKALTKASSGAINTALATGDILAGQVVRAVYDGTQFQIVSRLAN